MYLFGLLAMLVPLSVRAAEFRTSEKESITIGSGETVRNLYAAGNNVTNEADVLGDLIAAGNNVTINGSVEQGLFAAGNNVALKGTVRQNARLAGGTVNIDGQVLQDLQVAGGSVNINSGSRVAGDLMTAGGSVTVEAPIDGKAYVAGTTVLINSTINGDVRVEAENLELGDNARIMGKLSYSSPREATISDKAVVSGGINFDKTRAETRRSLDALFTLGKLGGFVATLFLLFALRYLFPALTRKINNKVYNQPQNGFIFNLGVGLAILVGGPILMILLAALIIVGWKIAIVAGAAYVLILTLLMATSPLLIGYGIVLLLKKEKEFDLEWQTLLIGAIAATTLSAIPVIGWIVLFFFFLVALGATSTALFDQVRAE